MLVRPTPGLRSSRKNVDAVLVRPTPGLRSSRKNVDAVLVWPTPGRRSSRKNVDAVLVRPTPGLRSSRVMAVASPPDLERLSAEEVLTHMVERFHPRLSVACSFQKEGSVIMDMLLKIEPTARFFTLDTSVLFPETYEVWRQMEKRYGVEVEVYQGPSLARQAALHGDELWKREPDKCCEIRKVRPLAEALSDVDAWMSGLRRDQSPARASTPKLGWDQKNERWKASPLADWTENDVWRYISENDVPYNDLHDRGYASIGCTHCTLPGNAREGRWSQTGKAECGLH